MVRKKTHKKHYSHPSGMTLEQYITSRGFEKVMNIVIINNKEVFNKFTPYVLSNSFINLYLDNSLDFIDINFSIKYSFIHKLSVYFGEISHKDIIRNIILFILKRFTDIGFIKNKNISEFIDIFDKDINPIENTSIISSIHKPGKPISDKSFIGEIAYIGYIPNSTYHHLYYNFSFNGFPKSLLSRGLVDMLVQLMIDLEKLFNIDKKSRIHAILATYPLPNIPNNIPAGAGANNYIIRENKISKILQKLKWENSPETRKKVHNLLTENGGYFNNLLNNSGGVVESKNND